MNSALTPALTHLGLVVDAALQAAEVQAPNLSQDGLDILNKIVVPRLDVPKFLMPMVTGGETKLKEPLDKFSVAELELLRKRLGAIA